MSTSWKFKQVLNPYINSQGYPEAITISGNLQDGNNNNIIQILFNASGEMYYTYDNVSGGKIYDSRELNGYLRGNSYVSYPYDYVVTGTYREEENAFVNGEGEVIPARTNVIYCDEAGSGVYRFNGVYNNLLGASRDYNTVSIDNRLFVILSENFSQDTQDIVNILNTITTKSNTYFLRYQNDNNTNKYILSFENYYQYSHYCVQDDNERVITLSDDFYSIGENAKAWLLSNAEFDTETILFTTDDSLTTVANAIRDQVGDAGSTKYYFPDKEGAENTFVKKIKQLNNTSINNGNPAEPEDVVSGKQYWLNGELREGTMHDNGIVNQTISTKDQVISIPAGHISSGTIQIDSVERGKIISSNIKKDVEILGISGSDTVIETNPSIDSGWSDRVAAPADKIVEGYSAYLNGNIIDGTLPKHDASEIQPVSSIMYPSEGDGTEIKMAAGGAIDADSSYVWGQATNETSEIDKLKAYPMQTRYNMSFKDVADRRIVSQYIVSPSNEPARWTHSKLSENLSKFPQSVYVLGYQGTAKSYTGDIDVTSQGNFEILAESDKLYYIVNSGGYFSNNSALYAPYTSVRNAYNSNVIVQNKIHPDNIKSGSTIFGISGNSNVIDTSSSQLGSGRAPIISSAVLTGYSGFVNGRQVIGSYNGVLIETHDLGNYLLSQTYSGSINVSAVYNGISHDSDDPDTFFAVPNDYVTVVIRVDSVPHGGAASEVRGIRFYRNDVLAGSWPFPERPELGEFTRFNYSVATSARIWAQYAIIDTDPITTYALEIHFENTLPFGEKTITENGTYNAIDDGVLGYSKVTANAYACVLINDGYFGSEPLQYVQYPATSDTKYYTAGDVFVAYAGNRIRFFDGASISASIALDGETVAASTSTTHNVEFVWEPDSNFTVTFEERSPDTSKIIIERIS